jgi:hypothetical protein
MTPGEKAFLICLALFVAWIVWEICRAPEGWQDEDGFHYGHNPEDDE